MSSISTVVIKKPEAFKNAKTLLQKSHYQIGFMSWCLWTFAAIIAVASTETNSNVTGISVTFNMQDVLVIMLATFMLIRGLGVGNPYLVYPWILINSWNMYHYQYPSLIRMFDKFSHTRKVPTLAYMLFGMNVLVTVIKAILVVRIIQLSINLWYQRKLQNETMAKM